MPAANNLSNIRLVGFQLGDTDCLAETFPLGIDELGELCRGVGFRIAARAFHQFCRDGVALHLDERGVQLVDDWFRRAFGREQADPCLLYTSPSPRDGLLSRMPSSA